jgi:hypothetical protein
MIEAFSPAADIESRRGGHVRKSGALVGFARRSHAMIPATSTSGFSVMIALGALCFAGIGPTKAESMPDTENGRYALQRSGDSVIRLDTRTGAVSTCGNSPGGWACYVVPDERKAMDEEIGRLQSDNQKLRDQLAAREPAPGSKTDEALPKSDKQAGPNTADSQPKIEIPLPSDRDMDRMMSFVERAWRRLVDMANRMQHDAAKDGKI